MANFKLADACTASVRERVSLTSRAYHFSFSGDHLKLCKMDTSEEGRQAIITLHETGQFSNRAIASRLLIPRSTVNRIVNL